MGIGVSDREGTTNLYEQYDHLILPNCAVILELIARLDVFKGTVHQGWGELQTRPHRKHVYLGGSIETRR